jgi:hypothetical protein
MQEINPVIENDLELFLLVLKLTVLPVKVLILRIV